VCSRQFDSMVVGFCVVDWLPIKCAVAHDYQ
jgi:hypothetical protein